MRDERGDAAEGTGDKKKRNGADNASERKTAAPCGSEYVATDRIWLAAPVPIGTSKTIIDAAKQSV